MGAWIEIFQCPSYYCTSLKSHPTMGAWIEIDMVYKHDNVFIGRTPRWVRGLK